MKKYSSDTIINILLAISVFFIPVWPTLPPFIWTLVFIYWLVINRKGMHFKLPPESYLILFASFYLVYLLGMLWSHDMEYGFRDIGIKVPMLLFPLFFSLFVINDQTARYVKNGIVLGCIVACMICLANASINYFHSKDYTEFFYVKYSILEFPAYFAMGLNLAILILMNDLFDAKETKYKIIYTLAILFLVINIIQLSEKMALIGAVITIPFYLIAEAKKRLRLKKMLIRISAFFALFIMILFFYFKSMDRFSQVTDALKSYQQKETGPRPSNYYNSSTLRLTLWEYGVDMFKDHWLFGVGTGDIKDEEVKRFKADNFQYGLDHFETPPGQYIHVAVILGIFGLAFLLGIYFVPLYFSFKYKDYLYAGFLLIYIINSVTGTVLSASSVLYYGFFNAFLYVLFEQEMQKVKAH